nr:NHLP family bacteriocin export ABC transporter peptidase/permease/ATPase subunit [Roseibium sp. MMSF_3544]
MRNRRKVPTVLQMEAAECGAASLSMVLAHHGRFLPLETLREACGVSRDGSKATNILKAARQNGMTAKGFKAEPDMLAKISLPAIIFVDFCHFLVLEGFNKTHFFLNDPANGRRKVDQERFDAMFTGVVLVFEPGPDFVKTDDRPSLAKALFARTKGLRSSIFFVFLASLALILPGLAIPIFSSVFVDQILVQGHDNWLLPLLGGMALTFLLRFALSELQRLQLIKAHAQLAVRETRRMFIHLLKLPIAFFGTRFAGDIATRLDLSTGLAGLLTGDIAASFLSLITGVFFLGLMLSYSPLITACVVLLSLFSIVAVVLAGKQAAEGHRKLSVEGGKLHGVALSGLADMESYKAAGSEDAFFQRWAGSQTKILDIEQDLGKRLLLTQNLPVLLNALTTAAILVLGGRAVMNGSMTIGSLVAFQSLAVSFSAPLLTLTGMVTSFQEIRSYTDRIEDVVRHPVDRRFEPALERGIAPEDTGTLEVENISFGYLPLADPLIEGFSLSVAPGGSVALVGASGSGKSTIGRLVAGLLTPTAGEVRIGGMPIRSWPRNKLANCVSYLDQEIVLFEGSVRENVSMWDETLSEEQIIVAAKDAQIHDVISSRAGGYDSLVAQDGVNFSGGQRQRLEIARALATNPDILVLDEATSALDAICEVDIMRAIKARGITLVVIAHRLSTIRDCDEILVLDNGNVAERGTHDELIALNNRYAELIEA